MDTIIQLLQDYKEYTSKGIPDDLLLFGEWLKQKYATDQSDYQTEEEGVNEAGLDVMAAYQLCGLTNFVEVWIKLTYQDLPLVSLGDFGIIKVVEFAGNPSKKMISDQVVMERTTCNESIKRLVKEGVLQEEVDPTDRRVRRVSLTDKGHQINQLLNIKMTALGTLLVGNLTEVEKRSLIPPLKKLGDFHHNLYQNKSKTEVKELFNL